MRHSAFPCLSAPSALKKIPKSSACALKQGLCTLKKCEIRAICCYAGGTVARLAVRSTCPTNNSGCAGGTNAIIVTKRDHGVFDDSQNLFIAEQNLFDVYTARSSRNTARSSRNKICSALISSRKRGTRRDQRLSKFVQRFTRRDRESCSF